MAPKRSSRRKRVQRRHTRRNTRRHTRRVNNTRRVKRINTRARKKNSRRRNHKGGCAPKLLGAQRNISCGHDLQSLGDVGDVGQAGACPPPPPRPPPRPPGTRRPRKARAKPAKSPGPMCTNDRELGCIVCGRGNSPMDLFEVEEEGICAGMENKQSIRTGLYDWLMKLNGGCASERSLLDGGCASEQSLFDRADDIIQDGGSYHGIWVDGNRRWIHVKCACKINWDKLIHHTDFENIESSTSRLKEIVHQ